MSEKGEKIVKVSKINTSVSEALSQPQLRGVFLAANGRNWLPLDRDPKRAHLRASVGFTAYFASADAPGACKTGLHMPRILA